MNLTLVKVGEYISDIIIDKDSIYNIISENKSIELLGQFAKNTDTWNPEKLSHTISNLRYNNILNSLDCTIIPIDSAYGKQLDIMIQKFKNKLLWSPIFKLLPNNKLKLITVNVGKHD